MHEEKNREWFEVTLKKWLGMKREHLRDSRKEELYEKALTEHFCKEFSDTEYVRVVLEGENLYYLVTDVLWIARNLLCRKLVLDRNCVQAKGVLRWLCIQNTEEAVRHKMEPEEYAVGIMMLAESITLTGETEETRLSEGEKRLLGIPDVKVVCRCFYSGFLLRERISDYMEYVLTDGARALIPLLVNLKYKLENKEENPLLAEAGSHFPSENKED